MNRTTPAKSERRDADNIEALGNPQEACELESGVRPMCRALPVKSTLAVVSIPAALAAYCEWHGVPVAAYIQAVIDERSDALGSYHADGGEM